MYFFLVLPMCCLNYILKVDSNTIEGKLFPRVSALGERLWSNPNANWKNDYMDTEIRMVTHRHLLVDRGIKADALQIEYCFQNEGSCELQPREDPDPNTGVRLGISIGYRHVLPIIILLNVKSLIWLTAA